MYAGSPMEKASVRCVDCHMAKIGYRSDKTAKKPHPWDTSSHTFMVATAALEKSSGVRSACVACHNEKNEVLPHVKKDVQVPPFSLDDLAYQQAEKKAAVRSAIGEVFAVLAKIRSTDAGAKERVERAKALVNFVMLDGSMGLHNSEKATAMLDEALKLAKSAAGM
jgi:formate-dependent nitrite reductase cytochrome c552 subunit